MLASVLLASAISTHGSRRFPKIVPPTSGAVCMGSPKSLTLLQDNIPYDNRVSTSIVNIWAFVPEKGGPAKAWLFLNGLGDYYMLFNGGTEQNSYLYLPASWRYFEGHRPYYRPTEVTPDELVNIETIFGAHEIIRVSCFFHNAQQG